MSGPWKTLHTCTGFCQNRSNIFFLKSYCLARHSSPFLSFGQNFLALTERAAQQTRTRRWRVILVSRNRGLKPKMCLEWQWQVAASPSQLLSGNCISHQPSIGRKEWPHRKDSDKSAQLWKRLRSQPSIWDRANMVRPKTKTGLRYNMLPPGSFLEPVQKSLEATERELTWWVES